MRQDHQNMIDEIQGNDNARLYGNEMDFIESIDGQDRELTERQAEWLKRIWGRVFGG